MMARTLVEIAEASCRAFAERPIFGERTNGAWTWMTYREVGEQIDEARGGLAALGIEPGDRVAIISHNSAAWAIAAYATYGLGATFVPMYEAQRHDDVELILRDCSAAVVFVRTAEIAAAIEAMRASLPELRHVIVIEGTGHGTFEALRARGRAHPAPSIDPDPDSIAGFIYTSGTTGKPKGVMLTHANIASNIQAATSVFPLTSEDRSVSFLPWAHIYGQAVELHALFSCGASTAFNRDVTKLVDDLREVQPTMLVAVPRIFNKIHDSVRAQIAGKPRPVRALFARGLAASIRRRSGQHLGVAERIVLWLANLIVFAKIRRKFGGRLKYTISASATLSHEVGEFIDALGLDVYEGYGLSETAPVVTANRPGERKLGSVGKPIPGVTIRIDERLGNAPGTGEIVVYGPNVMKGYHARPDENARAFTADGGLRTGDLGRIDEDGYLYITGRIKEQFKLENGKYVMPTPLEEQLALSPYISMVMLYGADRPYTVALVVVDPIQVRAWARREGRDLGPNLSTDPVVHELVNEELAAYDASFRSYERPRAFVIADDEPTTANGMLTPSLKIKRQAVVERYGAALDALYGREVVPPPPRPAIPGPVASHAR